MHGWHTRAATHDHEYVVPTPEAHECPRSAKRREPGWAAGTRRAEEPGDQDCLQRHVDPPSLLCGTVGGGTEQVRGLSMS
jgi:hypothetical protein